MGDRLARLTVGIKLGISRLEGLLRVGKELQVNENVEDEVMSVSDAIDLRYLQLRAGTHNTIKLTLTTLQ